MPYLAEILAIASNTPSKTVELSPSSSTVLLTALDAMSRWYDWQGATFVLSPEEKDLIDEIVSRARFEVMSNLIGEIKLVATESVPTNCLICDGGTYEKADYPDLYALISPTFIVDADHFKTPDLREKFVFGADNASYIGTEGGEANHTLTIPEIPSHSHTIPLTATTLALEPGEVAVLTPIPFLTDSTGNTGSDESHNNIPPYMKLLYCIVAR